MADLGTILVHKSPGRGVQRGPVDAVFKVDADKVEAAMAAAKGNGGDEVFYQVGQDTYVATARSMAEPFQARFAAKPAWNPIDDEVGVKASAEAYESGLTRVTAKGFDNEFQTGSEYASSKISNWGEWLGSLFGRTHRKHWERQPKPTYDADAFARFGQKLGAGKVYG